MSFEFGKMGFGSGFWFAFGRWEDGLVKGMGVGGLMARVGNGWVCEDWVFGWVGWEG